MKKDRAAAEAYVSAGKVRSDSSTVKRALRAARVGALVNVEVRRVSAFRNDTNVVTIAAREWTSWLRLAARGVGSDRTRHKYL